jgi:outer membrane protein assembly factor BamD
MAQSEAEYKDFILFYPTMEEAAESQGKICQIHVNLMEKADRDPNNAFRAEQECRQLLVQFPNSKFARDAEQRLREIQEVLAESEMVAGDFYHHKGAYSAAANRLTGLVGQYPPYSKAAEALLGWRAIPTGCMGPRFRPQTVRLIRKSCAIIRSASMPTRPKKKLGNGAAGSRGRPGRGGAHEIRGGQSCGTGHHS